MNIGEKIVELRKSKKLTQKEFAELIGVAEITIRQYENNKRQPRLEQLQKIADALEVNISEFLGGYASIDALEKTGRMFALEDFIKYCGWKISGDESEGYMWIELDGMQYEITDKDLTDLAKISEAFINFQLHEMIKNARCFPKKQ